MKTQKIIIFLLGLALGAASVFLLQKNPQMAAALNLNSQAKEEYLVVRSPERILLNTTLTATNDLKADGWQEVFSETPNHLASFKVVRLKAASDPRQFGGGSGELLDDPDTFSVRLFKRTAMGTAAER